ncbi:DNA-binding transcriptional MocR family regulator [Rhizobium soli]|uniref:DNA-binding transcriptional MocR family regulator n=1 Tax=Rhizobium soli TaxID=424798 RepID=A0A7X0JP63_9HYPH|nr:DNA-binding transcriptional MocR family regulator [Rhizobium soli]
MSRTTISDAWSELRRQKIITGRGRNGTWVRGRSFVAEPERSASVGHYSAGVLDLTMAVPARAVLPKLGNALVQAVSTEKLPPLPSKSRREPPQPRHRRFS